MNLAIPLRNLYTDFKELGSLVMSSLKEENKLGISGSGASRFASKKRKHIIITILIILITVIKRYYLLNTFGEYSLQASHLLKGRDYYSSVF